MIGRRSVQVRPPSFVLYSDEPCAPGAIVAQPLFASAKWRSVTWPGRCAVSAQVMPPSAVRYRLGLTGVEPGELSRTTQPAVEERAPPYEQGAGSAVDEIQVWPSSEVM